MRCGCGGKPDRTGDEELGKIEERKQAESRRAAGCCTAGGSPGRGQSSRELQEVQRPQAAAEAEEPARTKLMGNRSDWLLPSLEQGLEGQREGRAEVREVGGHMEGRPNAPR